MGGDYLLDVAVVRLPRISNFDDFEPLAAEPGVRLRFIRNAHELNGADLVILPGTKSTVADLGFLRRTGLAEIIRDRAASGTLIIGICGGYQMLGSEIRDPEGVESMCPCVPGLELLPAVTTFVPRKTTQRVWAKVAAKASFLLVEAEGEPIKAYEIHMGQSRAEGTAYPFVVIERQGQAVADPDGATNAAGNVVGTYLHGLFQNSGLRAVLLRELAARKGVAPDPRWGNLPSAAANYDRLADLVRANLDLTRIMDLVGLEARLAVRRCGLGWRAYRFSHPRAPG